MSLDLPNHFPQMNPYGLQRPADLFNPFIANAAALQQKVRECFQLLFLSSSSSTSLFSFRQKSKISHFGCNFGQHHQKKNKKNLQTIRHKNEVFAIFLLCFNCLATRGKFVSKIRKCGKHARIYSRLTKRQR